MLELILSMASPIAKDRSAKSHAIPPELQKASPGHRQVLVTKPLHELNLGGANRHFLRFSRSWLDGSVRVRQGQRVSFNLAITKAPGLLRLQGPRRVFRATLKAAAPHLTQGMAPTVAAHGQLVQTNESHIMVGRDLDLEGTFPPSPIQIPAE